MPSRIGFCIAVIFGLVIAALMDYFRLSIAAFGHLPSNLVEMLAGYEVLLTLTLISLYGYMHHINRSRRNHDRSGS